VLTLLNRGPQRWREGSSRSRSGSVVLDLMELCLTHALSTFGRIRGGAVSRGDSSYERSARRARLWPRRSLHAALPALDSEHLWDVFSLGLYKRGLVLGLGESLVSPSAAVPGAPAQVRPACAPWALASGPHRTPALPGPMTVSRRLRGSIPARLEWCASGQPVLSILAIAQFGSTWSPGEPPICPLHGPPRVGDLDFLRLDRATGGELYFELLTPSGVPECDPRLPSVGSLREPVAALP